MNKTLWMTMTAFAVVGLASAALPTASACQLAGRDVVADAVNYVCTGEAWDDGTSTGRYAADTAFETIQFVLDTYGDDIPGEDDLPRLP